MSWYLEVWKNYADFGGRARRKEYWFFILFNSLAYFALSILDVLMFKGQPVVSTLYALAILVPSLSVTFRRLHDTGRSAWWILIGLIPLIGGIWFLILLCLDSEGGANQYGPNPKV
ncbi:MAG: DUF805 domain-containing protein [Candidatus Hydrogenedentes bacterium]|nr:DUF805 domain-containing protein [Candidatus Hydrogenedentota bacterium]